MTQSQRNRNQDILDRAKKQFVTGDVLEMYRTLAEAGTYYEGAWKAAKAWGWAGGWAAVHFRDNYKEATGEYPTQAKVDEFMTRVAAHTLDIAQFVLNESNGQILNLSWKEVKAAHNFAADDLKLPHHVFTADALIEATGPLFSGLIDAPTRDYSFENVLEAMGLNFLEATKMWLRDPETFLDSVVKTGQSIGDVFTDLGNSWLVFHNVKSLDDLESPSNNEQNTNNKQRLTENEIWHIGRAIDIASTAGVYLENEDILSLAKEVVAGDLTAEGPADTLSRALRATGQVVDFVANRVANRLGVQNIDVAPEDLAAAAAPFAGRTDMTLDEAVNQTAKHFEKGGYGLDGALSGRTVGELKAEFDATIKELNALHAPVENLGELPPVNRPGDYAFAALGDDFGALSTTPAFKPEHRDAMKKGATLNAFGKPADLYGADKWVDQTLAVEALVAQGLDRQWSTDTVSLFSDNGVTDAHALGGNLKDAGLQSTLEDQRNTGLSITSARDLVRNSMQASTYTEPQPRAVADTRPVSAPVNLLNQAPKPAPTPPPAPAPVPKQKELSPLVPVETPSFSFFGNTPEPETKTTPPVETPQEQLARKNQPLLDNVRKKRRKADKAQAIAENAQQIKDAEDLAGVSQRAIKADEDPAVTVAIGTTEKMGDAPTTANTNEAPAEEPKSSKKDRGILSENDLSKQDRSLLSDGQLDPAILGRPNFMRVTFKNENGEPGPTYYGDYGPRTGGLWDRGSQTVRQVAQARAAVAEAARQKGVHVTSGMMDYFAGEVARDPVKGFDNAVKAWNRVHGVNLGDSSSGGSGGSSGGSAGSASSGGGTTGRKSPEARVEDHVMAGKSRSWAERSVWGG